jgi:hypothetical protein
VGPDLELFFTCTKEHQHRAWAGFVGFPCEPFLVFYLGRHGSWAVYMILEGMLGIFIGGGDMCITAAFLLAMTV